MLERTSFTYILIGTLVVAALLLSKILLFPKETPEIVSRAEWGALPPKEVQTVSVPVPFVVLHHTYEPRFCNTTISCERAMRNIQQMHMVSRGWWDIGYNFCVGGTGKVYEGRGWGNQGAHAPRYNTKSVGICFIGDYTSKLPTEGMMDAGKALIKLGIRKGFIASGYKLLGHRQVRPTECPGNRFYEEIQKWPHWDPIQDIPTRPPQTTSTSTTPPSNDSTTVTAGP